MHVSLRSGTNTSGILGYPPVTGSMPSLYIYPDSETYVYCKCAGR